MSQIAQQIIDETLSRIQQGGFERANVVVQFVGLNRALSAAEPADDKWQLVAQAMHKLLDWLEQELRLDQSEASWPPSESAQVFSILLTIMAEAGQYRHEQFPKSKEARRVIDTDLLPAMGRLRQKAIHVAKQYLARPVFDALRQDLELEIYPLLDSLSPAALDRFMPFRVIQVGNVAERLYGFRLRTTDQYLAGDNGKNGLLQEIYNRKYLRFGTSGVRGRWEMDFTEVRAKQVAQAICDFLKGDEIPGYAGAENLQGKRVVIGYDSRRNAGLVAHWITEVCTANGFTVDLANRDTPTPALVYYLTDYLNPSEVAGLINCTASHNPPEWQGIKFNPRLGYPAPTSVTDFIAARINELQLLDRPAPTADLTEAEATGRLRGFDPITHYTAWILDSGKSDRRIPLNWERIRQYFSGHTVVIDEMHGAGRGYLTRLLGEIGVRHTVLHAERDPNLPGLDYANPEEPFINGLKEKVKEVNAWVGLGLDTDADRFGIVDKGGVYFRPNQMLPMLIEYLGADRGLTGRVIATQTGSPLIEVLASKIPGNHQHEPVSGLVPAYVAHPFYRLRRGQPEDRMTEHAFLVPVGIKYIEEQRRTDLAYQPLKPLPADWRDTILIGGEESSGLTTRGHVTDKDGIWADLLVLDMLAYYGTLEKEPLNSISAIWKRLTELDGCWPSYGGSESAGSNAARIDVDAILEAKEALINFYLDLFTDENTNRDRTVAGLEVIYLGGIRYDIAELQLRDATGDGRHFLRVRASGTEPINRIYVESSDPAIARRLLDSVLNNLERLSIEQIKRSHSEWHLADMLIATRCSKQVLEVVREVIARNPGYSKAGLVAKLTQVLPILERRSQRTTNAWIEALSNA